MGDSVPAEKLVRATVGYLNDTAKLYLALCENGATLEERAFFLETAFDVLADELVENGSEYLQ